MQDQQFRRDLMMLIICIVSLVSIFASLLISAYGDARRERALENVSGIYAADAGRLSRDQAQPIRAVWACYNGVHLVSDGQGQIPDPNNIYLPMDWSMFDRDAWAGRGKASYRLTLTNLPNQPLVLSFNGISPQMQVFINGNPAQSADAGGRSSDVVLPAGGSCQVVLEVDSSWLSGVYACPWLYSESRYRQNVAVSRGLGAFFLGGFAVAMLVGLLLLRRLRDRQAYSLFMRTLVAVGLFYFTANSEITGSITFIYAYLPFEQMHLLTAALAVFLGITAVQLEVHLYPRVFQREATMLIAYCLFATVVLRLFVGAYVDMDIPFMCLAAVFVSYQILCTMTAPDRDGGTVCIALATILIDVGIAVSTIRSTQYQVYGARFILPLAFLSAILLYVNIWAATFARLEEAAARETEARQKQVSAEIAYLTSQVQPHFQYNVLTLIQELCYTDPMKAADAIVLYSSFLRRKVDFAKFDNLVPFADELESIDEYIAIQRLRFQDHIRFEKDIQTEDFLIPPLSVQTLVENAVHHGLRKKRSGGGLVRISARPMGDSIVVAVADNGTGFDVADLSDKVSGSGLENCRFRIERLLDGQVLIQSTPGKGTVITIIIPNKEEDHHARHRH
jgi:signal transduction histidine kinase